MNQSKTPRARLLRDADALWQQAVCMAGKCLLCGRTKPLCGHHIKGKKARPTCAMSSRMACAYAGACRAHAMTRYTPWGRSAQSI